MVNPEEPRLKTEVRVKAGLRRCQIEGCFAAIVRKGDPDAGALLIKLNLLNGMARALTLGRTLNGELEWQDVYPDGPRPDADIEAYIGRAVSRDRDLWVVEVEDKRGWHPF